MDLPKKIIWNPGSRPMMGDKELMGGKKFHWRSYYRIHQVL